MTQSELKWESKLVLLAVLPFVGVDVLLETNFWAQQDLRVVWWTLGLSTLLGLLTWRLRAATPQAALTGAAITANLMYSTTTFPYAPWHTAMVPVLTVSLLAFATTRVGRTRKEQLGTAEARKGRSPAQVVANLGIAALVTSDAALFWMVDHARFLHHGSAHLPVSLFAAGLGALAEAAADTVSSETGQVFGGQPRLITTLRSVVTGTNGAISTVGTLAGMAAAAIVAGLGTWALRGDVNLLAVTAAGGIFGLFFDSLLGATLEARGWLNNDAVNFLSTASAAGFVFAIDAMR